MPRRIELPDADSLFDAPGGLRAGGATRRAPGAREGAGGAAEGDVAARLDEVEASLPGLSTAALAELRDRLEQLLAADRVGPGELRRLLTLAGRR